jgi:hypothetical protein
MNNRQFVIPPGNPNMKIPNLIVEPLPTDMQWQDLYNKAQQAIAAGLLTMDQYAYLQIIDNMKQAWGYLAVQQKRTEMKKMQQQQMIDQANTERQMLSNQQAQQGKEKMELLKMMGTVIGEYAKAAFANPMNIENPDLVLQKVNQQIATIYGGGNEQSGGGPAISGPGEQLAGAGADTGGEPVATGGQPVQGYEGEPGYGGELEPGGEYESGGEFVEPGAEFIQ